MSDVPHQNVGELSRLLADLALRADAGDDAASVQLNQLAERYGPEVLFKARSIAEANRVAVKPIPTPPVLKRTRLADGPNTTWDVVACAVVVISDHYGFDVQDVWSVVIEQEAALRNSDNLPCFGRLLEQPVGFAILGLRVAYQLIGVDEADSLPRINLGYH